MRREPILDGVPELLILRLLGWKEMYGYQLVAEIRARSGEQLIFGEGCVYPLLHRLTEQGLLMARSEEVKGRERRFYRLNQAGRKRLAKLEQTWKKAEETVAACGEVRHA